MAISTPNALRAAATALLLFGGSRTATAQVQNPTDCITRIRAAAEQKDPSAIPAACWRIGPLALGMTSADVLGAIGPADYAEKDHEKIAGKDTDVVHWLYVLPRNYPAQLAAHPVDRLKFRPTPLNIMFVDDRAATIVIGGGARTGPFPASCRPQSDAATGQTAQDVNRDYRNYDFAGVRLDDPLSSIRAKFGELSQNTPGDFQNLWPVPIAFENDTEMVTAIEIASSIATTREFIIPDFRVSIDPNTCLISGYTILPWPPRN